jgi:two-component system response regulator FlrC
MALKDKTGHDTPAIRKHCPLERAAPKLSDCARQRLLAYHWPGNVRELENVIQRSLILLAGETLTAADLLFEADEDITAVAPRPADTLEDNLKEREYRLIIEALREAGGDRAKVAERLRVSPRTLRYKLARMRDDGVTLPEASAMRHRRPSAGAPQ